MYFPFHSFVSNALSDDNSIDILAFACVLVLDQLYLNILSNIYRILKCKWTRPHSLYCLGHILREEIWPFAVIKVKFFDDSIANVLKILIQLVFKILLVSWWLICFIVELACLVVFLRHCWKSLSIGREASSSLSFTSLEYRSAPGRHVLLFILKLSILIDTTHHLGLPSEKITCRL